MENYDNVNDNKCLAYDFEGEMVRVFLLNGTILSGLLKKIQGREALIVDGQKKAFVNLNHVISISRL